MSNKPKYLQSLNNLTPSVKEFFKMINKPKSSPAPCFKIGNELYWHFRGHYKYPKVYIVYRPIYDFKSEIAVCLHRDTKKIIEYVAVY